MIPLLRGATLEVPHGFSTRQGGVSAGAFAELNLSLKVGDAPEHVAENARRFREATGARGLSCLDQVHGDRVLEVVAPRPGLEAQGSADAQVTVGGSK